MNITTSLKLIYRLHLQTTAGLISNLVGTSLIFERAYTNTSHDKLHSHIREYAFIRKDGYKRQLFSNFGFNALLNPKETLIFKKV